MLRSYHEHDVTGKESSAVFFMFARLTLEIRRRRVVCVAYQANFAAVKATVPRLPVPLDHPQRHAPPLVLSRPLPAARPALGRAFAQLGRRGVEHRVGIRDLPAPSNFGRFATPGGAVART